MSRAPFTYLLAPEVRAKLTGLVALALLGSPFETPSMWRHAVAVLTPEGVHVTSRADHASHLLAADLRAQAHETTARRVPSGCLLVWLEADAENVACAGFVLLDLRAALAEVRA